MIKLLFLRPFSDFDREYLTSNLEGEYEILIPQDYSDIELSKLIRDAYVCIGNSLSPNLLEKAKNLQLFQNIGAGVDRLDLELFKSKNIIVGNSHSSSIYVAEYAIALMYSLIKKTHHHDRLMRTGDWFKPSGKETDKYFFSDTIIGKKFGILGYGNIGKNIKKMLSGFNNQFSILKRTINREESIKQYSDRIEFVHLEEILSKCEIVFITLPLTNKTRLMIGKKEFDLMNKNIYLINIARAEIIEKSTLYHALSKGKIKGAALDVWYSDVLITENKKFPSSEFPFHKLDNIVLSSYRAGYIENESIHLKGVINNLLFFAQNGKVQTEIDLVEGY